MAILKISKRLFFCKEKQDTFIYKLSYTLCDYNNKISNPVARSDYIKVTLFYK